MEDRRYRRGDVVLAAAGGGVAFAYARDSGVVRLLAPGVSRLLLGTSTFRTLDEHAETLARDTAVERATVRRELERLARDGFIVPLPAACRSTRSGATVAVRTLAFPTCDRPSQLARTIASFLENAREAGRTVDVLVGDDTTSPGTREAYREELRRLAARYNLPIRYAGVDEKRAYASALAATTGVPLDVVAFGCCGDDAHGLTRVGANRNAILLDVVGEPVLMADDDVTCRVARARDAADGPLALTSAGWPLHVTSFETRSDAVDATCMCDEDLVGLHERWLARPALECLDRATPADDASAQTVRRLATGAGTVAATLTGIVGDCSWDRADDLLFEPNSPGLARTREMLQAAPVPILTDTADPMFCWCVGLDNRALLPPFPPIGRAEDVGFGVMLSSCFTDHYVLHLPRVLLHEPEEERGFSSEPAFAVGFNGWLPSVLGSAGLSGSTPERRLAHLGEYLRDLAATTPAALDDFVRRHIVRNLAARTELLEARMDGAPAGWRRDALAAIQHMRRAAAVPIERLYCLPGGRTRLQEQLDRLGCLLAVWPVLVAAARELRRTGKRVSVELRPDLI